MNVLISLTVFGMVTMLGGILRLRSVLMPLTIVGLLAALYFDLNAWNKNVVLFNSMQIDNFAISFTAVAIVGAMFVILFYNQFYKNEDVHLPEVFSLLIFSLIGTMVMTSFTNLLMLFLGLEILSLSLYVLAGLRKRQLSSNEAAIKYFLMGAFSTGFLLFGIAMLYGATGSFSVSDISFYLSAHTSSFEPFIIAGIILLMIGLLFKVAAAPFQFWTPDVYQGSPTLITGYMATVGKVAAVAAFLRLFQFGFFPAKETYSLLLAAVAVLTMFVGNIIAIYQNSMKRMLAYSSIAHAGYMLIALVNVNEFADSAILYYSVAYTLASLVSFVVIAILEEKRNSDDVNSFNGLSKSNPLISLAFAIAMISLSGIPPAAGFFAKFYIFSSAIKDGWVWLVVLAVINSFISVYYYFRPLIASYMRKGTNEPLIVDAGTTALLILLTLLTLLLGIVPGWLTGIR